MAHDEHEGFGPLHDGWGWDAPTLMRMAHMKRMMDGHGMVWVNGDRHLQGIFGWDGDGWGWDVFASIFGLCGPIMWDGMDGMGMA